MAATCFFNTTGAVSLHARCRDQTWQSPFRVNQELRRRTRVIRLFPNEASLVRLVSALLVETSEDWETENLYLNMENSTQPSVLKC
jgi:putative transposase